MTFLPHALPRTDRLDRSGDCHGDLDAAGAVALGRRLTTAAELLELLGYESLGPSPDMDGTGMWMKSYGARDILICVLETASAEDAAEAIYDAGGRDARDRIKGKWGEFQDSLKYAGPPVSWEQARELQKQLQARLTAENSMPHPADIHADGSASTG